MLLKSFHWIFFKDILLLSISSSLSSFRLVNVIANVLMRCVVAMVSNVSDSSNPWSGMLLYTHILKHSVMPQRECHTHICIHAHAHTACINTLWKVWAACMSVCRNTKSMRARVQSGVCQDETAAASCTRGETSCCFAVDHGRSAKISTNQPCWGWMQEVSLTASRRKTQKHYEATW